MPRPPQFTKKERDPNAPVIEKKPPKMTKEGSFVGCECVHTFSSTVADAAGQQQPVSVSLHVRNRAADKGLRKIIETAHNRPDKTVKFAGGSLRIHVVPLRPADGEPAA